MKKLILETLLGLCLVAALTGCSETRAEPAPAGSEPGSEDPTNVVPAMASPPVAAPTAATATPDLPGVIQSNPALEDAVRLLRAGVEESVLLTHIQQSREPFNVGTEEILYLTDLGASGQIINAMMARDSELSGSPPTALVEPAPIGDASASEVQLAGVAEAPAEEISVDYFQGYLAPYGIWVDIAGYGRCWQPTVAVTTSGWMPYADAGRWLYTDYGWYWYSDYTWGWAPFHYGRWFHHSGYGWCWSPGTVWGPSWVTWRTTGEYAGWAPLPPTSFISISIGVGWSTPYYWYTYVPVRRICDPRPRYCAVPYSRVEYLHKQARPCTRYEVARDHTIVNRGIDPGELTAGTGGTITRTRLVRTAGRPQQMRRGETFETERGLVRSTQPTRAPTRNGRVGSSTREVAPSLEGPTRQVPSSVRAREREVPDNALVMRGVPQSTSTTREDAAQPARRTPSATDERGSYFSARVPPGSAVEPGTRETTRPSPARTVSNALTREPASIDSRSRPSVSTPDRSGQSARPVVLGRPRTTEPANSPTTRSVPTRTTDATADRGSSRTGWTTTRSSSTYSGTRSSSVSTPRSTSVSSGRETPASRTTPFSVPSRSVPTTLRSSTPARSPFAPATGGSVGQARSMPTRSVPSASPTRFSPYSPASPSVRVPPSRTVAAPPQPSRSTPRVSSPPAVSRQPPSVSAPARSTSPSRSAPPAPARDRSAGRSGRD